MVYPLRTSRTSKIEPSAYLTEDKPMICNRCEHKINNQCDQGRKMKDVLGRCDSFDRKIIIRVKQDE